MKTSPYKLVILLAGLLAAARPACAVTNSFFHAGQTATVLSSNVTAATIQSGAYQFTYSVDGWWSVVPGGPPTGRFQSVLWPVGIDAQAITTGPSGTLPPQTGASITIKRVDGQPFDLLSFTAKILGSTAGAGASFELMPQLDGQDAFADPLMFDATGYAGRSFTHSPALAGYEAYILSLWMDYALTQLEVVDASLPPVLQISATATNQARLSWPTNASGYALQQNSALSPTNWTTVTNVPGVVGFNNQVTLPRQSGGVFFRLALP